MGPEAKIERTIRREAIAAGWLVRKVRFLDSNGAPDRLFGKEERAVWIEFKAPGEEPTPQQLRRHRELQDVFGFKEVYSCDSIQRGRLILGLLGSDFLQG